MSAPVSRAGGGTLHGRKFGEKDSYPIPIWNGIFEHFDRIGAALWEFAWCIDKVTEERDGVGIVLGGLPVKLETIVADLKGSCRETVRTHFTTLEAKGYVRRKKTPYGYRVEVLNSRKFHAWKRSEGRPKNLVSQGKEKPRKQVSETKLLGGRNQKIGVYKEDVTETQQRRNSGAAPLQPFWGAIGVNPDSLPAAFAELCERLYTTRDDQSLFDFMGVCMDAWESQGNRIPCAFARAKAALRDTTPQQQQPFPAAETEDWGAMANYKAGVR
jgi:hypothetical protein